MKVLKFGAVWCSGCLIMGPRWKEIEKELSWLKTKFFDYDKSLEIVEEYKIKSGKLPVFIFLDKKGKEFKRMQGEIGKKKLIEFLLKNKGR